MLLGATRILQVQHGISAAYLYLELSLIASYHQGGAKTLA